MIWNKTKKQDQTPDLYQKMAQMMGVVKQPSMTVSAADKHQITQNLNQLFYGLAWANWMQGMPLGQAWYRAGQQMESYVVAKDPNNPVTIYMRACVAAARVQIARDSMTHPNRDALMECPADQRDVWGAVGGRMTRDALWVLNGALGRYPAPQTAPVQVPVQLMAMMQQYQRNRETR